MLSQKTLTEYAKLIIKIGVNLQKGQGLEINCPTEKRDFAKALVKCAYEYGAKIVRVRWDDEEIDKLTYSYADIDALTVIPNWFVQRRNYLVENNFCYVAISAEDPQAFKNVPSEKLTAVMRARSRALKKFSDSVMNNSIRWCVVSAPTLAWAKQVFPNEKDPEGALSDAIAYCMRLDNANPLGAWQKHIQKLQERAEFLNKYNFSALHFKNSLGTDLTVGLADDHVWISAQETAKDGVPFIANLPTEEIFTAPHKNRVDGVLKSAMPLCENGQIIDNFTIKIKKGKIVSYSAEKGFETLRGLIETDSGTLRLGEVALIGKNSPIAKSNILFYNTLFDENASCHLAIGKAYPTTIKNGQNLTLSQLKSKGLNQSTEHVDFMIGTSDLIVTGITHTGQKIPIFNDGEWVI